MASVAGGLPTAPSSLLRVGGGLERRLGGRLSRQEIPVMPLAPEGPEARLTWR
jgi:hypothetical protein